MVFDKKIKADFAEKSFAEKSRLIIKVYHERIQHPDKHQRPWKYLECLTSESTSEYSYVHS